MITRSDGCRFLFLIVNATILVIISTRQRLAEGAVVTSSTFKPQQQHQYQQVLASPGSSQQRPFQQQNMRPTSERNNNNFRQLNPHTISATSTTTTTTTSRSANSEPNNRSARLIAPNTALETNALAYLQRYGYMQAPTAGDTSNNLISEESFSSAIAEFQRFAGLPETGLVDNETLNMMQMPRCGNTDKTTLSSATTPTISKSGQLINRSWALGAALESRDNDNSSPWSVLKRRKRYALQGSKWRRQELTYRISQYPTKFAGGRKHEVDAQIEKAFGIWSQVAPIDFVVKKEGRVHIDIRFASGDHGDGDAFDGPGNTLAHAYFPQYGGDAHFDDQEYWTVDSYAGTNIFQVAAHELGHSLGLGHSNVREALMAPFYQKYKPNFKLHIDDVLAIQALYGEKAFLPEVPGGDQATSTASPPTTTTSTTTSTTTTTTTARPSTSASNPRSLPGPIYRGSKRPPMDTRPGDHHHHHHHHDEEPAEPNPSDRDENGNPDLSSNGINGFGTEAAGSGSGEEPVGAPSASLPADLCSDSMIDTITRTEDGNSYVFKGDHYWLLTNEGLARGFPRRISADWEGLPGNLDAALTWADGKTFFFKGNKYWRFRNRRRDLGYPKLISAGFAGIPDDIDAAFVWSGNGRTYFFKGADYWRFDSKAEPPVSSEYPRSIKVWLGVPAHINAAFKWDNNVTYFFKGNQYYRFNDREFKVESRGRPPFPRPTSEWWFGCLGSNLAQRAPPSSSASQVRSSGQVIGESQIQQQPPRQQHSSRTARLHPNPFQRTATAALQSMQATGGGQINNQDPGDWSFLAGLSADQTRSMGTHISDHQKPTQSPDRRWREEETISELDIDRRLAPAPPGGHREPLYTQPQEQPDLARRRLTPPLVSIENDPQVAEGKPKAGFELAGSFNTNGPQYQTSSATTAIRLVAMRKRNYGHHLASWHDSLVIGRWLSVICAIVIMWLNVIGNRHTIRLSSGKCYKIR